MKKVKCDAGCQGEFILLEYGVGQVWDDIERVGFCCPHCNHQYTSHYTNQQIRAMQVKMQELLAKSDPRKLTKRQLQGVMFRIRNLKQKIAFEMDQLRKAIETD